MMIGDIMKHREIQSKHELFVLLKFKEYMSQEGKVLIIKDRPDPPDAIVTIDDEISWIEISDVWLDSDFAESTTSFVAEDKEHMPSRNTFCVDIDDSYEVKASQVISKKYKKKTISDTHRVYGAGILLVGLYSPFVAAGEIKSLLKMASKLKKRGDGRFGEIYLYDWSTDFYQVL